MKKYIDVKVTIPKGYVVIDPMPYVKSKHLTRLLLLIKELERQNIIFDNSLITALLSLDDESFFLYHDEIKEAFPKVKGRFFRHFFAKGKEIKEDFLREEEVLRQLWQYYNTYNLGRVPEELFSLSKEKKVTTKGKTKPINRVITVVGIKSFKAYEGVIIKILDMPIVFGESEIRLLKEAQKNALLLGLLKKREFRVKENLFSLILLLETHEVRELNLFKTANDLLRYALFVSGLEWRHFLKPKRIGEKGVLIRYPKFTLKTSYKKLIMKVLDGMDFLSAYSDIYPRRALWIAMGKNLFPASKKFARYKNAQKLFSALRNREKYQTYNGQKEKLIKEGNILYLIDHLAKKPGKLLRSLDSVIRKATSEEITYLIKTLKEADLNPKLIVQVMKWLAYRSEHGFDERVFNVRAKAVLVDHKPLYPLEKKDTKRVIKALREILKRSLKGKKLLSDQTKVWLDPRLKKFILPMETRATSVYEAGVTLTSGSRISLDQEVKFVRLFTAWGSKEKSANFDIDLSAAFIKKSRYETEVLPIAYYNQTSDVAVHSGDWTSCMTYAPGDKKIVAEYIDVDLEVAKRAGYDYVLTSAIIFSSGGLVNDFDTDVTTFSGVQLLGEMRTNKSREIDITDVLFKMRLVGKYQSHMPLALDLVTKEIVIIDTYSEGKSGMTISMNLNKYELLRRLSFDAEEFRENVYDFFQLYAEANELTLCDQADAEMLIALSDDETKQTFNVGKWIEEVIGVLG